MDAERKLVLAIDFNNVAFSSYYGRPLYNSHRFNVNAIKGFFFKLKLLKEIFNPDFIVCASDLSRAKTFRRKMYPEYKAQRKGHDPEIIEQMKYIQQLFTLIGFNIINNELYEADDVLGMIAKFDEENGMDTVIISSDRDLYQLVTDHTFIMSPRDDILIDKNHLQSRYALTPDQWVELKMLQGDTSDNIPGIRGIGPKGALALMQRYGSINNIYDHIQELQKGLQENLLRGQALLPLTRELVTIVTDYSKINMEMKMLYRTIPFIDETRELLNKLEIYSLFSVMDYSLFPQPNDKVEVYNYDGSKIDQSSS